MTREERKKIYRLLSQFYPRAKQLENPETLTAWGLVLENYAYDDVKCAVLDYAAQNKYFPDLADITAGLTTTGETPEKRQEGAETWPETAEQLEKVRQRVEAQGGPCAILLRYVRGELPEGVSGVCGLLLRSYCPEGCRLCRKRMRPEGCHFYKQILSEHARCPLLAAHGGEGAQKDMLLRHWKTYCPDCRTPCFWLEGMLMEENKRT